MACNALGRPWNALLTNGTIPLSVLSCLYQIKKSMQLLHRFFLILTSSQQLQRQRVHMASRVVEFVPEEFPGRGSQTQSVS